MKPVRCCYCKFPIRETGTAIGGEPAHIECYWASIREGDHDEILVPELILKLRQAEEACHLHTLGREPWTDENGLTWDRPTAWSYAQTCKALNKMREAFNNSDELIHVVANEIDQIHRQSHSIEEVERVLKRLVEKLKGHNT